MTVLTRYVLRRLLQRFALFLAIFLGVLVGGQLAIFIGRGAPPAALGTLLIFMLLLALPMALPMALTSAVLVSYGEMKRDGELGILAASGIDPLRAVWRAWPVIVAAVLACALLWHWIMPQAMRGMREQSARVFQAMIATRVASMDPIWQDGRVSAWAVHAEADELTDLFIIDRGRDGVATLYAPRARWALAGSGVRFILDDISVVQRRRDGELSVGGAETWSGVVNPSTGRSSEEREPDTLSTRKVWRLMQDERAAGRHQGRDCSDFNNARLTLHLRFYMPIALLLLGVFAAGVAFAFGAAESLLAIGVMIVAAALTAYPAIGYVKSHPWQEKIDPGILLWGPGLVLAGLGWWMLRRPQQVRERLAALLERLGRWGRR